MPELPEVETLKRCLERHIIGSVINQLDKRRADIRYKLSDHLESDIISSKIINVRRRAKYLLIDLDNNYSIIIHLGMTGRLTLQPTNYLLQKHDHLVIYLDKGNLLVFNDSRRFGMVYTMLTEYIEQNFLQNLGEEPLSDNMSYQYLKTRLMKRNVQIKNLLMDNHIIVGVGNIYASESLFVAKIDPRREGSSLEDSELINLVSAIKNVLAKAILAGGTTIKDFVSGDNKAGYFQQELQVYAREHQKCLSCQEMIKKIKQSGRATFYCPICQR